MDVERNTWSSTLVKNHDENKTYILVKLSESFSNAIQEYSAPSIKFHGSRGAIRFQNGKSYDFSLEQSDNTVECIRQTKNKWESVGKTTCCLTVKGKDDVYQRTRTKMEAAEQEKRKFRTKLLGSPEHDTNSSSTTTETRTSNNSKATITSAASSNHHPNPSTINNLVQNNASNYNHNHNNHLSKVSKLLDGGTLSTHSKLSTSSSSSSAKALAHKANSARASAAAAAAAAIAAATSKATNNTTSTKTKSSLISSSSSSSSSSTASSSSAAPATTTSSKSNNINNSSSSNNNINNNSINDHINQSKYPDITNDKQYKRYKAEFHKDLKEYHHLHGYLHRIEERFGQLKEILEQFVERSPEWESAKEKIINEYHKYKGDKNFHRARSKYRQLYTKLAHLRKKMFQFRQESKKRCNNRKKHKR